MQYNWLLNRFGLGWSISPGYTVVKKYNKPHFKSVHLLLAKILLFVAYTDISLKEFEGKMNGFKTKLDYPFA
jgi:hypothetical protein